MQHIKQHIHHYRFWLLGIAILTLSLMSVSLAIFHSSNKSASHDGGVAIYASALRTIGPLKDATPAPISTATVVASTMCANNGTNKLLLVSISKQHVWACDGTTLSKESAVTTGASAITNVDDSTPTGTWHIYGKQANVHLKGTDANGSWDDLVAYWMPFYTDYGFHDASWQTIPFGSASYTTDGSHGCVHLPNDMMAWVYNWAPIGTTVTIES